MAKQEPIQVEGIVEEALPSAQFIVKLNGDQEHKVHAHVSGKIRMNYIRILPGDKVLMEVSPYDLTKGRIVFRNKG